MKESTIITNMQRAERERLQNNQMIGALVQDVQNLQQMMSGFLAVMRKLPGYDDAIAELAKANEEAEAKAKAELEAIEVKGAEEVKPELDLGNAKGTAGTGQGAKI